MAVLQRGCLSFLRPIQPETQGRPRARPWGFWDAVLAPQSSPQPSAGGKGTRSCQSIVDKTVAVAHWGLTGAWPYWDGDRSRNGGRGKNSSGSDRAFKPKDTNQWRMKTKGVFKDRYPSCITVLTGGPSVSQMLLNLILPMPPTPQVSMVLFFFFFFN